MLGDGSIRYNNMARGKGARGSCRYSMTMKASAVNYLQSLVDGVYKPYCKSGLIPYPKPGSANYAGSINQYSFTTASLPVFTALHNMWYRLDMDLGAYVEIVPMNVGKMFSSVSLAHWIMEDGYFDSYGRIETVLLCTESFTEEECVIL